MHGLVIGRFQPFHNGHRALLQKALEDCQQVTVAIGSSTARPSLRNPFTAAERRQMVAACFPVDLATGRLRVVEVPDVNNPPKYVAHVLGITGPIDRAYGNDPSTLDLFADAGIATHSPGLVDRERSEASAIRIQLAEDDSAWRKAVPAAVAPLLQQWDAGRRLRGMEALA